MKWRESDLKTKANPEEFRKPIEEPAQPNKTSPSYNSCILKPLMRINLIFEFNS